MPNIEKLFICCVCAIISACWYPEAQSAEPFPVDGAGTTSCGKYLEDITDDEFSTIYVSWTQGFLSGMNLADRMAKKEFVSIPDERSIKAYLDKFCRDNPLETPFEGSIHLYRELRSNQ